VYWTEPRGSKKKRCNTAGQVYACCEHVSKANKRSLPKALELMEILKDILEVAVVTLKVQISTRLDGKFV
jgi:hypothetical protein